MNTNKISIKLTENFLDVFDACTDGRAFARANNLIGVDINRLITATGDHNGFVSWLKMYYGLVVDVNERGLITTTGCDVVIFKRFTYDEQDRISIIEYCDRNDVRIKKFSYDCNGKLISEYTTKPNGDFMYSVTYEYDVFVTKVTSTVGSNTNVSYLFRDRMICEDIDGYMYIGESMGDVMSNKHNLTIDVDGNTCKASFGSFVVEMTIDDIGNIRELSYVDGIIEQDIKLCITKDDRGNIVESMHIVNGVCINHSKNVFNYDSGHLIDLIGSIVTVIRNTSKTKLLVV